MGDITNSEAMPKNFSRREFLKLSGAGTLALFIPDSNFKDEPIGIEKTGIVEIKTPNARYFPVYEDHTHPVTKENIAKLSKLNVYFYEGMNKSSKLIQKDAVDLLNTDMLRSSQSSVPQNTRKYAFPRDHIELFSENNTEISLEGYALPETEFLASLGVQVTEAVGGAVGALAYLAAKKKHKIKGVDKPLVSPKTDLAIKSTLAWLLAPIAGTAMSLTSLSYFGTDIELNSMQRIVSRVTAMTTHVHPESNIIFFRNLLMSRKLQFLGEFLSGEHFSKPKIGYNVGMEHGGIEDFMRLSPDIVLALINAYPKDYLNKIVEYNGGVDAFCSTILLTPDTKHSKKTVIQDKKLRLVLESKLAIVGKTNK